MIIISSKHPSASFPARRGKVVHIWYNLGQGILGKVGLEGKDVTFHIHLAKALGDLCQAARSDSQMQFKGTKNKSTNQTAPGEILGLLMKQSSRPCLCALLREPPPLLTHRSWQASSIGPTLQMKWMNHWEVLGSSQVPHNVTQSKLKPGFLIPLPSLLAISSQGYKSTQLWDWAPGLCPVPSSSPRALAASIRAAETTTAKSVAFTTEAPASSGVSWSLSRATTTPGGKQLFLVPSQKQSG